MGKRSHNATSVRTTVVKPLGLMTTPNAYGQFPPGALRDAKNCLMRRPGEVMSCPSSANYTQFESSIYSIRQIAPMDAGHLMLLSQSNADNWIFDECTVGGSVNAAAFPPFVNVTSLFSASRVTTTRSRDRVLFNTRTSGVFAQDFMQPASLAQRTLRRSGLPQPWIGLQTTNTTTGSAIPQNIMVGYRALFTRESSDGYILKGVPSVPIKYLAQAAGPTTVSLFVSWPATVLVAGDYVELYRTDGLSTTSVNSDPGGTFKLVYRVQLTATDITNQTITIADNQVLLSPYYTTYGRELYTNPYQEGETAANRQADISNAMGTFKGFTFYGNLVERAQPVLSAPGGFNDATLMPGGNARRATGVGTRSMTATVTNGSPNVTGISAAEMVGIVVGQYVSTAIGSFPFGTKVNSVGASSFVASANATSSTSAAGGTSVTDVIEVDGFTVTIGSAQLLVQNLQAQSGKEVTVNQSVTINNGADSAGLTITIEPPFPALVNTTLRATNGQNYSPPLPLIAATVATFSPSTIANLLRWSKDSEPEHVPSANETRVGSGQIIAMAATKDALWIGGTDGVYRLSGAAGVWRLDLVAPGLVLCSPRCMVNMRETIYAYTNFGFGSITDSGFLPISQSRVRASFPGPPFSEAADLLLGRNDVEGEVLISTTATGTTAPIFVWNTLSGAFTYLNAPSQHFAQTTAFAWLENPASGNQCTVFGVTETGQAPGFFTWNAVSTQLDMQVNYYPIYGDDPLTLKQWIDLTFNFLEEAAGYTLSANINAVASFPVIATGVITQQNDTDAAITVGIPRTYAINPIIRPGFSVAGITTNRVILTAMSLRYARLTHQRNVRQ